MLKLESLSHHIGIKRAQIESKDLPLNFVESPR
jgi:hypothetical protein